MSDQGGGNVRDGGAAEPVEREWWPRRSAALAVLLAAGFMDLLDTTIVNVAIPSVREDLDASYADIQWIVAAYLLAFAVGLITGGRLGDIAGRKRVFLVGVAIFGLTSLASGLAPDADVLVIMRALQGLSAAIMVPQILSIVRVSFPPEERTRALALYSTVAGVAVMSGPLLAGVLLDVFGWSWRSIFLINVPVSLLVIGAAIAVVPDSKAVDKPRLDLVGVGLVSTALFCLVFGIIQGRQLGWPSWVFAMMAASLPLAAAFVGYERSRERAKRSPLVSPSLFASREFTVGLVTAVILFSGLVGFFLAFTVFLQLGLGFTPLESALTTFPSSVGLAVASQLSAKVPPGLARRVRALGVLGMAVAMVGLILTVRGNGADLTAWDVRPVILVFGLGMGLILPSLADIVIAGVEERHAGAASGVVNTGMQVGNAIGVAIIGLILFSAIESHAPASVDKVAPRLEAQLTAAGLPPDARDRQTKLFRACFEDRSRAEDPDVVPASCRGQSGASLPAPVREQASAALAGAATQAREDNFVAAIQRALLYEVAVFGLTLPLIFLLPARVTAKTIEDRFARSPEVREVA